MRNSACRASYISKGDLFSASQFHSERSQPHNFEVSELCGLWRGTYHILVLLGYHRSYRDKGGAIDCMVAQNSQNFVERNKSYQFL
jgi:hypothetical protein